MIIKTSMYIHVQHCIVLYSIVCHSKHTGIQVLNISGIFKTNVCILICCLMLDGGLYSFQDQKYQLFCTVGPGTIIISIW